MTLDDGQGLIIELSDDLEWQDRFKNLIRQDSRFTIGGSFILSESKVKAGNTVTLAGGDDTWIKYSVLKTLMSASNELLKTFTLTMPDGETMTVGFKQPDPISATPLLRAQTYGDDDDFNNVRIVFYRIDEVA